LGLGIVCAQGKAFDVPGRTVGFKLLDIGFAVPELSRDGGSVKLHPARGSGQRMLKARQVNLPRTHLEIEIVFSAVLAGHSL